jgi:hypothetical protein
MKSRWFVSSLLSLMSMIALPVIAQSSATFRVEASVFNSGGHPAQGLTMTSSSYRISMDSIGESLISSALSSSSFELDSGLGSAYRPAGLVTNLRFASKDTMDWDVHRSAGRYNLYRDELANIGAYGSCFNPGLISPSASDSQAPASGAVFFYLVTVVNRLGEEGGKDSDGSGVPRGGVWCP